MDIQYNMKLYQKVKWAAHRFFPNAPVTTFDKSIEIGTDVEGVNVIVTLAKSKDNENLYAVDTIYVHIDETSVYSFEAQEFVSNIAQSLALVEWLKGVLHGYLYDTEKEVEL